MLIHFEKLFFTKSVLTPPVCKIPYLVSRFSFSYCLNNFQDFKTSSDSGWDNVGKIYDFFFTVDDNLSIFVTVYDDEDS